MSQQVSLNQLLKKTEHYDKVCRRHCPAVGVGGAARADMCRGYQVGEGREVGPACKSPPEHITRSAAFDLDGRHASVMGRTTHDVALRLNVSHLRAWFLRALGGAARPAIASLYRMCWHNICIGGCARGREISHLSGSKCHCIFFNTNNNLLH